MAEFIQSVPSISSSTWPTNTETGGNTDARTLISGDEWGIDNVIEHCIIQSETITEARSTDDTLDQKGALVSQLDYDIRWDLNLTLLVDKDYAPILGDSSAFTVGDTKFKYMDKYWKITQVQYTGSYNAKKQFTITAFRTVNFPKQED